ncbi:hypothetical protein E8L98_02880 [Vibrio cholerae]|nr:hypothetical protein [Vibrio cholerae]
MKISLQAYQPLPVLISGQWVHLEAAEQAVILESSNGDRVTMRKNAVIKSEQIIGRVLVHSEIDQEISLEFGYGDYTPPQVIDGQTVVVSQLPAVELKPDQVIKIEVSEQLSARESVMPFSIAANAERCGITLKAKAANTADILINGVYPLSAGESLELKTRAAIELTGAITDSVAILEW